MADDVIVIKKRLLILGTVRYYFEDFNITFGCSNHILYMLRKGYQNDRKNLEVLYQIVSDSNIPLYFHFHRSRSEEVPIFQGRSKRCQWQAQ